MELARRRLTKIYGPLLAAILLFAFAPVASVLISATIATQAGCDLDEGSVHSCMVMGRDIGETLYALFVAGWFGLITLPIGALAFLAWAVALIAHVLIRRLR
jgi:hypothetical protein